MHTIVLNEIYGAEKKILSITLVSRSPCQGLPVSRSPVCRSKVMHTIALEKIYSDEKISLGLPVSRSPTLPVFRSPGFRSKVKHTIALEEISGAEKKFSRSPGLRVSR